MEKLPVLVLNVENGGMIQSMTSFTTIPLYPVHPGTIVKAPLWKWGEDENLEDFWGRKLRGNRINSESCMAVHIETGKPQN